MICPTCGARIADGIPYCTNCGCAVPAAAPGAYAPPAPSYAGAPVPVASPFVSPDESLVATLSNGFATNLISGEGLLKEDAYVTNKRVYYNSTHGFLSKTNVRNVVDIPEVTGTKLVDIKYYGFIVLAAIFLITGIILLSSIDIPEIGAPFMSASVVFLCLFFTTMKKHLRIEYAGGFIYFSVRKYTLERVHAFQKAIYQEKDKFRS